MATDIDAAIEEARAAAMGQGYVERLLERIGGVANAEAVFGRPIERDGVTVIPVARMRWGAGGGGGSGVKGEGEAGEGAGGGGGVMATPLGYIEIKGGDARFVRIRDLAEMWPLILVAGASLWLVLRGFRGVFRAVLAPAPG